MNLKYLVTVFYLYLIKNLNLFNCDAVDVYSRLQLNDFIINLYYVFWTNSWYLYLFLLVYIIVLINFNTKTINSIYSGFFMNIILIFFLLEFLTYWNSNNFSCFVDGSGIFFNQLLSNSVNKFHPFLLYLTFISILIYPTSTYNGLKNNQKYQLFTAYHVNAPSNLQFNVLNLLTTLYLGSWWALQEGSWGGWWNWDPSEVLGLVIIYLILSNIHTKTDQLTRYLNSQLFILNTLTVLLFYYFIQLNFRLVSHNFGTKVVWFVSPDQLNLLTVIVLIGLLAAQVGSLKRLHINLAVFTWSGHPQPESISWFFYLLLFLQILFSFSILINDFVWSYFKLNILNTPAVLNIDKLILLIIIYFSVMLLRPRNLSTLFGLYLFASSQVNLLLIYLLGIKLNLNSLYHKLVLGLVTLSYLSPSLTLSDWSVGKVFSESTTYASLNSQLIELSSYSTTALFLCEKPLNFITNTETSESVKTFISIITNSNLVQTLVSGSDIYPILINVLEPLTHSLNLIFWVVWFSLIYSFFSRKIIIF
jgi:hypothetical protein